MRRHCCRGPWIVGLILPRRWGWRISIWWCRWRSVSIWHMPCWRRWWSLKLGLCDMRRHGMSATLGELRGLGIHGMGASCGWCASKNVRIRCIPLRGRGGSVRPVIPATLAPQIRHFHGLSAIEDEQQWFNQIRKVYLVRDAKKAKGVSGLIVESVQGVARGLFKIVDNGRNNRGGTRRKYSVGNDLERNNRLSQKH